MSEKKKQAKAAKNQPIARIRRKPGCSVFCINTKTGKITNLGSPTRIDVDKDCIYRLALNEKNFIRKLKNQGIIVEVPKEEVIAKSLGLKGRDEKG